MAAPSVKRLIAFIRGPRPALPQSLPRYIEDELDKVSAVTNNIVQVLIDLEARITALEAH